MPKYDFDRNRDSLIEKIPSKIKNALDTIEIVAPLFTLISILVVMFIYFANFIAISYANFWQAIFFLWLIVVVSLIFYFTVSGMKLIRLGRKSQYEIKEIAARMLNETDR